MKSGRKNSEVFHTDLERRLKGGAEPVTFTCHLNFYFYGCIYMQTTVRTQTDQNVSGNNF